MSVHPNHQDNFSMALRAVIAGLALLVLVYFMPHLRQLDGMANYLPLHIGLETLSVVMSSLPFVLIWSLRRQAIARNYAVLACGLLAVALLDFIHMLSYKGMPDFFGPSSPEKAIYFWLAARAVDATNLLLVAYLGWDKVASRRLFRLLLMGAFALVAAISLVYFNFEPHLPRTFKASTGLTPLKIGFEYVLILLYGLAALGFYLGLRQPPKVSRSWLFAAACVMAQGEFLFTIYTDVNDIYNITGHFYKLFAYAFVFRAAFIENVRLPYKQLQSSRDHMQATLEALPDLVFEMDIQGNFLDMYVSQRNSHLLLAPEGVMIGKNASEIMAAESAQKVLEALQQASQHGLAHGAIIHVALSKQEFSFELSVAAKPRVANETERFVVLARDITEAARVRERIRQLSYFDHLTNLPNRASLQYYFDEVAGLRLPSAAFVWIDLDQFKNVNDSLGHSFGDILLQVMAKRFCQVLDPQAMVTRISGDDFVAFLPRVSVREALEYADRILHVTAEPVQLNGHALIVTASIGISMYPGDAREFDELLMHAEAAMYRAKAEGRNRYRFYEAHMQAQMRRALAVSSALRQAQENNEFTLVYQPQFSVDGARIVGVEALLRWHSSELGQVGPEEFIPLAEESDLILGIGAWVLESVVKQIKQWLDAGVHEPVVSINLSAAQFSLPDLPEQIATVLRRYDVPAGNLMIEITEASAMHAPLAAARRILELRKLGVLTAIDDFGTGYSSLAYLQRFKVHQIKIDQSFVCDIDHSAQARAIARAVIELARALEMDTLAEGVETRTQLEFLQANGCTSGDCQASCRIY